jgi:pimeloyl-ACP methyl ester carboxylesterase
MDRGLLRFAESQMNTEAKRKKVYFSWVVLRHLEFKMPRIASYINQYKIDTILVAGQFDKVIKPESLARLSKHLDHHRTIIIPSGHNHLLQHEQVMNVLGT